MTVHVCMDNTLQFLKEFFSRKKEKFFANPFVDLLSIVLPNNSQSKSNAWFDFVGDCDAGFYCDRGANVSQPTDGVTGGVCPAGNYCPQGTAVPIPCEDGKAQLFRIETLG